MKTKQQRERTVWDWRLKLYPLIVILWAVYFSILGAPTSRERPLLPTQAEQVLHDPAPEREGEIAV